MPFLDRRDAGRRLAERLRVWRGPNVVVLGLPRGGVPVAYEVATTLRMPLDIALVRKLTVPQRPWLVFGALGENGVRVIDPHLAANALLADSERERVTFEQREQLRRSIVRYRHQHARLPLSDATAVIVDDGIATGASAHAACLIARARGAIQVVFATPVGSSRPIQALAEVADHIICLETPQLFGAIRPWYLDFKEVTDTEVCALLTRAAEQNPTPVDLHC